ncbi:hypothetical protein ACIRPX_30900 [Streptomyces sp. NPDC101225]|uniref:hypothetical protein n=1 Tax=Streptomyces sp. NPDC101225 TaxID=3366135 RepID=UPI00380FEFE5
MFTRRTVATVSGLLGSLAVIYVGGAQAYADQPPGDCRTSAEGETTCVHKSEAVHKGKNGTFVVKQDQKCSTLARPRLVLPDEEATSTGTMEVGPVVDCSNTAPLPKGFKRPHVDRPHIQRPHIEF